MAKMKWKKMPYKWCTQHVAYSERRWIYIPFYFMNVTIQMIIICSFVNVQRDGESNYSIGHPNMHISLWNRDTQKRKMAGKTQFFSGKSRTARKCYIFFYLFIIISFYFYGILNSNVILMLCVCVRTYVRSSPHLIRIQNEWPKLPKR